ncbi:MAG: ADP-ribosylglycohydrolase family protein, partial [bacterium]|nr:ADP-ribosylglycohydrolase family protein [bacterium]
MTTSRLLSRYYRFFACGDAVGKATEFMTPDDIRTNMGRITGLVDPARSITHPDLPIWAVTDDTEQNLWLLRRYLKDGKVTIENTVSELVKWIEGTGAVEKHYIGPSSLKALQGITAGQDPLKAGINGTTCGGIMRAPAAVFAG